MQLSIGLESRKAIIARSFQAATAVVGDTIEAGVAELESQYRLQLAAFVPLADKRNAVASLIDSSLSSEDQDQISDSSVVAVFSDLVRAGLIDFEVEWTVPPPPPPPEPIPTPGPLPPIDPSSLWLVPPPPAPYDLEDLWPPPTYTPPLEPDPEPEA